MFKAARTFNVNSNNLKHANSIEVAKSLNVHGLLIEAEHPIPEGMLEFFTKRKANLERISEDGEYFLRLSGIFEIKRSDVVGFLQERAASSKGIAQTLVDTATNTAAENTAPSSSSSSSEASVAYNFQKQVQARLKILHTGYSTRVRVAYHFYENKMNETHSPVSTFQRSSTAVTEGDLSMTSGTDTIMQGSLKSAGKNIKIRAGSEIKLSGIAAGENIPKGILAEMVAGKDINFSAKSHVKLSDSVVFSGEDINIRSDGDVELSLTPYMAWVNVPPTPSLVFIYEKQLSYSIKQALQNVAKTPISAASSSSPLASIERGSEQAFNLISRLPKSLFIHILSQFFYADEIRGLFAISKTWIKTVFEALQQQHKEYSNVKAYSSMIFLSEGQEQFGSWQTALNVINSKTISFKAKERHLHLIFARHYKPDDRPGKTIVNSLHLPIDFPTDSNKIDFLHTLIDIQRHSAIAVKNKDQGLQIWVCGANEEGQLGLGDKKNRPELTRLALPSNFPTNHTQIDFFQIALGTKHTAIAVKAKGQQLQIWVCGSNSDGQLGLGDTMTRYTLTPLPLPAGFPNDPTKIEFFQLTLGGTHTAIAVKAKGQQPRIWVCGCNAAGQLGLGDQNPRHTLASIDLPADFPVAAQIDFFQVALGIGHSAVIVKARGQAPQVWVFGYNGSGQLGLGDRNSRNTLTPLLLPIDFPKNLEQINSFQFILRWSYTILSIKTEEQQDQIWTCGSLRDDNNTLSLTRFSEPSTIKGMIEEDTSTTRSILSSSVDDCSEWKPSKKAVSFLNAFAHKKWNPIVSKGKNAMQCDFSSKEESENFQEVLARKDISFKEGTVKLTANVFTYRIIFWTKAMNEKIAKDVNSSNEVGSNSMLESSSSSSTTNRGKPRI